VGLDLDALGSLLERLDNYCDAGGKEARVEIVGWPCARIAYCRVAMRGLLVGQTELFCTKAYASEVTSLCTATSLAYRVAWA
jgi:hypothetical protein